MTEPNLVLMPFDLPGKIYRSPMPFGAFDMGRTTLAEFRQAGIGTVVMLTVPGEDQIRANRDLTQVYHEDGMQVIHFPIEDFATPENIQGLKNLLEEITAKAREGENFAVHCYAGRGRTGTVLALLARRILGLDGDAAIRWVRQYFPAIETTGQENLVRVFPFDA